ncbi:MAG: hypothetical protein CTY12_03460 [Methylotenera sp.]|nr:MAG: hypothetical protein CTY12_03460 [Methylotenera sp.]
MKKALVVTLLTIAAATSTVAVMSQTKDTCTINKVVDGDTVHATCSNEKKKIRLTTIDAFESKRNQRAYRQAYEQRLDLDEVIRRGKKATEIAKSELEGKEVTVKYQDDTIKDRYNRDLGEIYIDGVDINNKMLKEHPDVFLKY